MNTAKDLDKFFDKAFTKIEKQIEFAAVLAANAIAKDVEIGVGRQLKSDIDRPTPFTSKAFKINRANKKTLSSSVEIKPIQAKYLKYQIEGGTRSGETVLIPRKSVANKYGNMPRNKLSKLKQQGKTYVANGVVIQKMARKVKPLAFFAPKKAQYKKIFKFFERSHSTAKKVASRNFMQSLRKTLATAK